MSKLCFLLSVPRIVGSQHKCSLGQCCLILSSLVLGDNYATNNNHSPWLLSSVYVITSSFVATQKKLEMHFRNWNKKVFSENERSGFVQLGWKAFKGVIGFVNRLNPGLHQVLHVYSIFSFSPSLSFSAFVFLSSCFAFLSLSLSFSYFLLRLSLFLYCVCFSF